MNCFGFDLNMPPQLPPSPLSNLGRIKELKAVVVGAGLLGNEVCSILGLLRLKAVTIVDPDRIENANLAKCRLFLGRDVVGTRKASTLSAIAQHIYPETQWYGIDLPIADVGFSYLDRHALLFSCVDNQRARLEIAFVCSELSLPMIDGGLSAEGLGRGRVSVFPGGSSACYACVISGTERSRLLSGLDHYRNSCWTDPAHESPSSLPCPTIAAVIGAIQADLGIRTLDIALPDALSLEVRLDSLAGHFFSWVPRDSMCPFHTPHSERISADQPECSIGNWLVRVLGSQSALVLDWPLCVKAICLHCDHSWNPKVRAVLITDEVACPRCHSSSLVAAEVLRTITPNSEPWATMTFADIGLPLGHRYRVCAQE